MKYYIQQNKIYKVDGQLGIGYKLSIDNSYADYMNGKIVELNEEQITFYNDNPTATIEEIYNCEMKEPQIFEENIIEVKNSKITNLENFDKSSDVNSFIINGTSMWLDRHERASLGFTVAAYESQEIDTIELWYGNKTPVSVTLEISQLKSLLISIELYAKQCYDQTARHKKNILEMTNIEDIKKYDFKVGYPSKISI